MQKQGKTVPTVPQFPVRSAPSPLRSVPTSLRESDLKRVAGGATPEAPKGGW
jgi:hypothetical protein